MTLLEIPFPAIDPVALQLGPVAIRWYGLAYAAGLILGWLYIRRLLSDAALWSGGRAPMTPDDVDELLLWVTGGVILGGRLGHVLFYQSGYYFSNPMEIFAIWQGGMSFHGGLLGTGLAMLLFARRHSISVWPVMDVVSAAVPIGLFFGRVANFINAEVVGSKTDMPWGMVFPGWGAEPRHPAMLYEAALEGTVLFVVLAYLVYRRKAFSMPGLTTGAFLAGYAVFRIFCELFKIVDYRLVHPDYSITKGMVYSVPMLILGLWFIHKARNGATAAPGERAA